MSVDILSAVNPDGPGYAVVSGNSLSEVVDRVGDLLADGWAPVGGVALAGGRFPVAWAQAMVCPGGGS